MRLPPSLLLPLPLPLQHQQSADTTKYRSNPFSVTQFFGLADFRKQHVAQCFFDNQHCNHYDPKGYMSPPLGPISFIFIFWGKIGQLIGWHPQLWNWCPLWEIPDPPLIIVANFFCTDSATLLMDIHFNWTLNPELQKEGPIKKNKLAHVHFF